MSEQLSTRILSEQARIKSDDIRQVKLLKKKLIGILKPLEIYIVPLISMKHQQLPQLK